MKESDVMALRDFWRVIVNTEEFIRQYGANARWWEDMWRQEIEDAYERIRPALGQVSKLRIFYDLPGNLDPSEAENYHHALANFLNPPERWFGSVALLSSPEYLELKRGAKQELKEVAPMHAGHASDVTISPLEQLNETQHMILQAMNDQPQTWSEIAEAAGFKHDVVRRHSKTLQELGFIRRTKRGFILATSLNEVTDCDA